MDVFVWSYESIAGCVLLTHFKYRDLTLLAYHMLTDQERIEMWYNEYHVGDHYKGWYDVYNSCCCCCCCCCWAYLDMKLTLID